MFDLKHTHPVYTEHVPFHYGHDMPGHHHSPMPAHGFCHSCCHPVAQCCCGLRECRKEAKELLVIPKMQSIKSSFTANLSEYMASGQSSIFNLGSTAESILTTAGGAILSSSGGGTATTTEESQPIRTNPAVGHTGTNASQMQNPLSKDKSLTGQAESFIGGGCCVHLSIEYMPEPVGGKNPGAVAVLVIDSENTALVWKREVKAGDEYQIKEGIISTNPGAKLYLFVEYATARVRWCECFSC